MMESSKIIIDRAKKRFKELEHKEYDWRSFYSGFIEATTLDKFKRLEIKELEIGKKLSKLEEIIEKAKPNMDKIKDVDAHLDSIKSGKLEDGNNFSLDLFLSKTKEDLELAREEMNSEHLNIRLKAVGKFHTIKGIRDGIKNGEFRADLKADTDMKKEDLKDLFEEENERGYTYKQGLVNGFYADWLEDKAVKSCFIQSITRCVLSDKDQAERKMLIDLQQDEDRWFSEEEFNRLLELNKKAFENHKALHGG